MDKKIKARQKHLWDNYKLTLEQYDAMLTYQGGACYACGQPEHVKGRSLAVDHNHQTGLVRGLLCSRCNPVLGKIERAFYRYGLGKVLDLDVVKWMFKISRYMYEEPATKALGYKHFGYIGRTGTKAHRKRLKKERKNLT